MMEKKADNKKPTYYRLVNEAGKGSPASAGRFSSLILR
jgi:hypothetical protein